MLIKRYKEFIDHLIDTKRFDISLSFVTNGTILDQQFIDKLKLFANIDIEISIETIDETNDYIRQGSRIGDLLSNIELVRANQDEKLQLILRTVPQALSIGSYAETIRYARENRLIIEGIPLINPRFMSIDVVPKHIRSALIPAFEQLLVPTDISRIQNGRNIGTIDEKLNREIRAMITMLSADEPKNVTELRTQLADHLSMWDRIYKMDAPQNLSWIEDHGYAR